MQYKVISSNILYPETVELKIKDENKISLYKVLDTYRNLEWLLKHFNASIRFNLMTRRREISFPEIPIPLEDSENSALAMVNYLATLNGMPIRQLDSHLNELALENSYHPIVECLKKNPWDGSPRLDEFIKTIEADEPELAHKIIKTWMVATIAAPHMPNGITNHGALVIQGPQGIGKTAWIRKLPPFECGAVKVGALVDPTNKDSIIGLNRFWIVEIGELDATFKKSDIARLKSFITSDVDDIRVPWGKKETHLIRRTTYAATVNESNFLVDTTGNRRWWTIAAKSINYEHDFDMIQVWAEVYNLWTNGAITYLSKELQDEMNKSNEGHEEIDPLYESILVRYDWHSPKERRLTATDVLKELGYAKPSHNECGRVGKILTRINNAPSKSSHGRMVHFVPQMLF